MLLSEIVEEFITKPLNESVTFGCAVDRDFEGRKVSDMGAFEKEKMIDCRDCDGSGKYQNGKECFYCKGTGKEKTYETEYDSLNVSNHNAAAILAMLDISSADLSGKILHNKLPEFRRKLIKLKNQGASKHTEEPTDERGKARHIKGADGMSSISTGPRVISGGRSQQQIDRYLDQLLSIADFAQKNNANLVWV